MRVHEKTRRQWRLLTADDGGHDGFNQPRLDFEAHQFLLFQIKVEIYIAEFPSFKEYLSFVNGAPRACCNTTKRRSGGCLAKRRAAVAPWRNAV